MYDYYEDDETYDDRPSKSQRKREMLALQKLGERLVELTPEQLERMDLPAELSESISFYRGLKDKEAKRRQMQFIGAVMRKIDVEPVHAALGELDQLRYKQADAFHQIEEWRDALLQGDTQLLEELVLRFDLERHKFRQMVRAATAERTAGQPPKQGRALFRLLRQGMEAEAASAYDDDTLTPEDDFDEE